MEYAELTKKITKLLQKEFQIFFKHAIEHLLKDGTDFDKTMYVFSIQQSLEILLKLYVVNQYGVLVILDFEQSHDIYYCNKPESDLLDLLNNKKLKTRDYNDLLKILKEDIELTESEKELLSDFQKLRNQIVHMGIDNFTSTIFSRVNLLVAGIFNKLEYKEQADNSNDMENTLIKLLGKDLFNDYLSRTSIITDTEQYLTDNFDYDDMERIYCLECSQNTAIKFQGEYRCYLCGFKMHDYYAGIMECPDCNQKSFYFDPLNTTEDNNPDGNCPCCGAHYAVAKCNKCGEFYIPNLTKCFCDE